MVPFLILGDYLVTYQKYKEILVKPRLLRQDGATNVAFAYAKIRFACGKVAPI
jgi:hypothetical protein